MTKYKKTKKEKISAIFYVSLFVALIVIGAIFLIPDYWYILLILLIIGLFILVKWHARTFAYRCSRCGHKFEISAFVDFISPHGPGSDGWKYLRCPKCKKMSKAIIIRKQISKTGNFTNSYLENSF